MGETINVMKTLGIVIIERANIQYFVSDINQVEIQRNTWTGYITHVQIPRTCQLLDIK